MQYSHWYHIIFFLLLTFLIRVFPSVSKPNWAAILLGQTCVLSSTILPSLADRSFTALSRLVSLAMAGSPLTTPLFAAPTTPTTAWSLKAADAKNVRRTKTKAARRPPVTPSCDAV